MNTVIVTLSAGTGRAVSLEVNLEDLVEIQVDGVPVAGLDLMGRKLGHWTEADHDEWEDLADFAAGRNS